MSAQLLPIGTRVAVRFGKITRHGEIYDLGPKTYAVEVWWGNNPINYAVDHDQVTPLP